MAEKINMIALSPTMEAGVITRWNKQEGDNIESGDLLCEVETDKATMDYEATTEGTLLKILIPEGGRAAVGHPIAIVGQAGEDISSLLSESSLPLKQSTEEPDSPALAAEPGESVGQSSQSESNKGTRVKASPLARKIAESHYLDMNTISGSGPAGRVVKRDVEQALKAADTAPQPGLVPPKSTQPAPVTHTPVLQPTAMDIVIPVSGKRRIIAERLAQSKYTAPHYYLKVTIRGDELLRTRDALNASLKEKVSFNAFLIKFVSEALKKHPMVNASWNGDTIIQHRQMDIALAVAQSDGLITPVIRDCGNKGITAIDRELKVLIEKALNNTLQPEEYTGASFTISNLGSFGIDEFTAIINPPGSAILAVGRMKKEPAVDDNDQIIIQSNMKLTLSCDHRVIDGAVGAAFLKDLREMLEDPVKALY